MRTAPRPTEGPAPLNPMELQLLETLGRAGRVPIRDIRTRWPLVRMHLPVVLERLVGAGLAAVVPSVEPGGVVVLTERGRAVPGSGTSNAIASSDSVH